MILSMLWAVGAAAQPAPNMSFFVVPTGPTYGMNQPTLQVTDQHCATLAYAQGISGLQWRAYLDGKASEGEGGQLARNRIGTGPWHSYYGVVIAESVAQLHSDANNLSYETVSTVTGDYAPQGFVIPPGSQLDGSDFTRAGPFFCFGFP
ncbi:MAG: hypothetical protein AB7T31_14065 [Gemmatimonadales bacterium]